MDNDGEPVPLVLVARLFLGNRVRPIVRNGLIFFSWELERQQEPVEIGKEKEKEPD